MSAPPAAGGAPPPLPAMDGTVGALLIGALISCLMLGITSVQLYMYSKRFPLDSIMNKVLVYWVWVVDVLQTVFQCHAIYFYLVTHYADPTVLAKGVWSLDCMSLMEALIGGPVEVFFAIRVWKLSGGTLIGKLLTVVILVLTVVHTTLGFTFSIMTLIHPELSFWHRLKWDSTTGLTSAAVADVLIAVSMVYFLRTQRTVFAQSKSLVNQLMLYSIESGALTSVCAICAVVTFLALNNLVSVGLLLFLPKLYANSLMAMLNSRRSLRERKEDVAGSTSLSSRSTHLPDYPMKRGSHAPGSHYAPSNGMPMLKSARSESPSPDIMTPGWEQAPPGVLAPNRRRQGEDEGYQYAEYGSQYGESNYPPPSSGYAYDERGPSSDGWSEAKHRQVV